MNLSLVEVTQTGDRLNYCRDAPWWPGNETCNAGRSEVIQAALRGEPPR